MYDVVIIGAGVIGCAVARFLSMYQMKVCVLERGEDVCTGTSKANSGIVHSGVDAKHGTAMARYNVIGNRMMPELARDLDVPFEQNGSLIVCLHEENLPRLRELFENGKKNGVEGLEILTAEEVRKMEPNLSKRVIAAIWAPTGGIICPFSLTIALAENAAKNGVEFRFDTEVKEVHPTENGYWSVVTAGEVVKTRIVVNAAGVYSDFFHNMVSRETIHITPRRGEYCLLDKKAKRLVKSTVFQVPGAYGKGVLVTPSVHGNIILGPTAVDIEDKEGTNTTGEGLNRLLEKAGESVEGINLRQIITSFAGLRAHEDRHEFILGETSDAPGFYDCAGIESPGLTAAPAIGEEIARQIHHKLGLLKKPDFDGYRRGFTHPEKMTREERNALIQKDPSFGRIVCRCESVSEGEILEAIRRTPGARSPDGVKRRVRAGSGRCQSGFCALKVMDILAKEQGIPVEAVTKSGGKSRLITGRIKEREGLC